MDPTLVAVLSPGVYPEGEHVGGWAPLAGYAAFSAIAMAGDVGGGSVSFKLSAARDSSGTGAQDIPGAETAAIAQNDRQAVLNLNPVSLAGFTHFRAALTAVGAEVKAGVAVFGFGLQYAEIASSVVVNTSEAPGPAAPEGYDNAARIAGLRANAGFGSKLTTALPAFPQAANGLELPELPTGPFTSRTVDSLEDLNTYINDTMQDILLAAGTYNGTVSISTGTHNRVTYASGVTGTININVNGAGDVHHIYLNGGDNEIDCNISVWTLGYATTRAHDIWVDRLRAQGDHSIGFDIAADRLLFNRCRLNSALGTCFIWPQSTNVLVMDSDLSVPKIASEEHENPFRMHGAHLCGAIDSRLRTYLDGGTGFLKHCFRFHSEDGNADGGIPICINNQLETGGIYADYAAGSDLSTPELQSVDSVIVDNRIYTDTGVFIDGRISVPYQNLDPASPNYLDVMNVTSYCVRNTYYADAGTPGDDFITFNFPPGTETDNVFAAYVSPPAWDHAVSTPTTA